MSASLTPSNPTTPTRPKSIPGAADSPTGADSGLDRNDAVGNEGDQAVDQGDWRSYRAVSKAAIFSLSIGLVSVMTLPFYVLLVIPLIGFCLGVYGLVNIRRYPRELTGTGVGVIGTLWCLAVLVGGSSYHTYVYATEVPDGYQRVTFWSLQPDPGHPELPIPPSALELDGEKVFVKGYVFPDGQSRNIRQFVLVRDKGDCCFGGQPKLTDMIQVTLKSPLVLEEYSDRLQRLGGVLKVDKEKKPVSGLGGVYYQLEADYLK